MVAPPPVFSDLFDDATKWDEPVPDYDALILLLGGVASTVQGGQIGCRMISETSNYHPGNVLE